MRNLRCCTAVTFLFLSLLPSLVLAESYVLQYRNNAKQGLSSAVCAVHTKRSSLFTKGAAASEGLAALAEDGDPSTFIQELRNTKGIKQIIRGGFVSARGKSSQIRFTARPGQRISCVFGMLVATNDGFPAVQSIRLPNKIKQRRRIRAFAYDAGSEVNTESCLHVPGGPCNAHFIGEEEGGTIQRHEGILDIADLSSEQHGWPRIAVRGRISIEE